MVDRTWTGVNLYLSHMQPDALMNTTYEKQIEKTRSLLSGDLTPLETLTGVVELLATNRHFDWVGIYFLLGDTLRLGPYVGEVTEHTEIKIGAGVCGTAVLMNENQVVEDVNDLDNYIACSIGTKSEIVVLIKDQENNILAQFDLDSDTKGAFGVEEEEFLEKLAYLVHPAVKKHLSALENSSTS